MQFCIGFLFLTLTKVNAPELFIFKFLISQLSRFFVYIQFKTSITGAHLCLKYITGAY